MTTGREPSSARFGELVTRWRRRIAADPFLRARLQLVALYFVAGSAIYVFITWFIGAYLRQQLYSVVLWQNGEPAQHAIAVFEHQTLILRASTLTLFFIAALLITEFALRPIRKASELQQRFIATVSHELRTPIAIMRNESEMALRHPERLTTERAAAVIGSNVEELDRLARTLQFLLTFSDLKNRSRAADLRPVRLEAAVAAAGSLVEKERATRDVRLALATEGTHMVTGNATALERLVLNLVHNALQHTAAGGTVAVRIGTERGRVRLDVADTGAGIAPADLPYIFQPFYRGAGGAPGGVGLGLSIVREIAELHHARLSVDSKIGEGATFTVLFPRFIPI